MIRQLTVLCCVFGLFSGAAIAQSPTVDAAARLQGLPIAEFFDVSYREILLRDPERVTILGLSEELGVRNDRLTDMTSAYVDETQDLLEEVLEALRTYDRDALSRDDRLSYDVYEWFLQDEWEKLEHYVYDYLITSFTVYSEDWMLMDLLQNMHPLNAREDADDLITRIGAVREKVDGVMDELWMGRDVGIVAPKFMIERSIEQMRTWLGIWMSVPEDASGISPYGTELYQTTRGRLKACDWMTPEEQDDYTARAVEQIVASYIPAFLDLLKTMSALYEVAPLEGGAAVLPDGDKYLDYAILHHTTTDLSADEMWRLGLSEVERIQEEMRDGFSQMGYPRDADMQVLWQRAYADAELPAALSWMEKYELIRADIEAAIEPAFDLWPSAGLEIRAAPAGTTHNYYMEPAHDGSRPGIFYAQSAGNPYAFYSMPVVFHHEAIPGHHVQLAIMQDLDLPLFRRVEMPTASGEGWAVYAEGLAYDLGVYEGNPLGNLERLKMELMRAARVVVEMGVHHLGWSYREGAAYFADVMGYPIEAMIDLMPRYVGYPGQGSSYTVGLLKVRELRQRAMDALGETFRLSEFHNIFLQDGALPLAIHERLVDEWIAEAGE